jgi:hypothetical protein
MLENIKVAELGSQVLYTCKEEGWGDMKFRDQ